MPRGSPWPVTDGPNRDPRRDPNAAIERGSGWRCREEIPFAPHGWLSFLLRTSAQSRNGASESRATHRNRSMRFGTRHRTSTRSRHSGGKCGPLFNQVTPPCPIAQIQSRHDVEKPHEPGGLYHDHRQALRRPSPVRRLFDHWLNASAS